MRLVELQVHRLPGIPRGFTLDITSGVTLVTGPNGSGKTSLTRAIRSLFWSSVETGAPFAVEARFEDNGVAWKAVREDGRAVRWWRDGEETPAPEVPDDHLRHCYEMGVLDLVLPPGGEAETALAGVLNRELSGGYDLVDLADTLFPDRKRTASQRRQRWQEERTRLDNLRGGHRRLAEQEKELGDLRERVARGRKASEQLRWWRDRIRREEVQADLVRAEQDLDRLPAGQDKIRSEDHDLLARMLKDGEGLRVQTDELGTDLAAARSQLAELAWPDADPRLLVQLLDELEDTARQIEAHAARLTQARARLDRARQDLDPLASAAAEGGEPDRGAYPQAARLFARLTRKQGLGEGLAPLLEEDLWQRPDADQQRERLTLLRRWLTLSGSASAPWPVWLAVLAALVGGGVLLSRGLPVWGWPVGLLGLIAGAFLATHTWRGRSRLRAALARLEEAGLDIPAGGESAEIWRLFEEAAGSLEAESQLRPLHAQLKRRQQALAAEAAEDEAALQDLRDDQGLGLDPEDPDLLNLLDALPRFREAAGEVASCEAEAARLDQKQTGMLMRLAAEMAPFGEGAPADTATARAALNRIQEKERRHEAGRRTVADLEKDEQNLAKEGHRLDDDLKIFWERLELPPDTDPALVASLVDGMEDRDSRREKAAGLRSLLAELDRTLADQPDGLVAEVAETLEGDNLRAHLAGLEGEAEKTEDLARQVALIEHQVDEARQDRQVAEAGAACDAAREDLEGIREEMREAALGRLLLLDVEDSHQRTTRPRVLERAINFFREFTRGHYELRVQPGPTRQGVFVAHDLHQAVNLGLGQISDGTRAQLLLAVRLAFITENESGVRPPLFLDESLTSSDPARFAAMARNLSAWAADQDRQVFYLTSQPADAIAWQEALEDRARTDTAVIDLAARRGLAAAPASPLRVAHADGPPPPGTMTGEEYARALGVPVLDPWQPATAAHLWYLVFDDPDLLHRLLLAATTSLGLFRSRRDLLATLAGLTPPEGESLSARGAALEAFLASWRVGRGRPLPGFELESSGHISGRFLGECLDLLAGVKGDAAAFLQGLRQRKVKGFRMDKIAGLEEHLDNLGYLDPRQVLAEDELLGQVQTRVLAEIRDGHLSTQETRRLVDTWRRALQAELQSGSTDRSS